MPARTITANPKLVLDPAGTVRTLTAMLKLTPSKQQSLTEAFTSKKNSFVYVARQIDPQLAQTIVSLRMAGISSLSEDKRILPDGDVGRSLVGRTDPDLQGTGGLEKEYNDILKGVDGEQSQEHDREFRSIAGGDETVSPVPGSDIVLTLDRSLQYQVEKALKERVETLTAVGGTAIVYGVNTGDVYASANVRRNADGTVEVTSANLAATDAHEPGSVAKVFSLSAAVNEGLATPETTINVPGFLVYRPVNKSDEKWKFKIRDAEPHDEKPMSLRDIIVHSSNIGTVLITEGLGTLKFGQLPPRVRVWFDHRARPARRELGNHEACGRLAGHGEGHAALRIRIRGHVAAARRRGQHHRQRWCLRRPAPGPVDDRRQGPDAQCAALTVA